MSMKIFIENVKILFLLTLALWLSVTIMLFCGCSTSVDDFKTESIVVNLPQWDSLSDSLEAGGSKTLPQLAYWQVEVYGEGRKETFRLSAEEPQFLLSVKINQPVCVLASPVTISTDGALTGFFKPAGSCYPYEENSGSLWLKWELGFAAYVMKSLFVSGKSKNLSDSYVNAFVQSFNWKKLCTVIFEKSEKDEYNPWFCDSVTLLKTLSEGNFNANLLNHKNVQKEVALPVECLCDYVPWNYKAYSSQIIKTDRPNSYLFNNKQLLVVIWKSEKNILQDLINLPIYTEEI